MTTIWQVLKMQILSSRSLGAGVTMMIWNLQSVQVNDIALSAIKFSYL